MSTRLLASTLLAVSLLNPAFAAETAQPARWDVASPPGERREVRLDVRSGTWMSLDVSPNGRHIVFDMLGDLYQLPIEGGQARALTAGLPWDMQPRYSPDGALIAFTSDRAGGDNLWVMPAGGGEPRQLTKEDFRLLNNPSWHPSGRYLAGRKHFTTRRSLGTGEIWLYHLEGGEGVPLIKRPNEEYQKELGEPAFSADGLHLYYTQNSTPGNTFEYAQDVNKQVFTIRRQVLATGETEVAVSGPGGAVRPTPSPDGRYLAFVRRLRTPEAFETALFLKDLQSGEERALYTQLDRDMQETWAVHGLYPNMDWTPDSRSIVFWAGGGIKRVDIASRQVSDIAFQVIDTRSTIVPPRFEVAVAPDEVPARMVRFASVSPDGKRVVFEAFGRLWLTDTAAVAPRRLTQDAAPAFEVFPSWSRDGKRITFVRWSDATLGQIHVVNAGGGRSRAVTKHPGHYLRPRFNPDGTAIVFERSDGDPLTSRLWAAEPGIYILPLQGGEMRRLTDKGHDPHFGASGERLYYTEDAEPAKEGTPAHEFLSVDLNGKDRRVHARSHYASLAQLSPNGRWLAFRENYNIYVAPVPPAGAIDLSPKAKAVPLRRASAVGGDFFSWADGDTLTWTLGPKLYQVTMGALFATAAEATRGTVRADLGFTQPADKPSGTLALTGAQIITMNGSREVIDNGTIVIRDNRIVAVGAHDAIEIPADAQRLDLRGHTVMPGLVDIHAHGPQGANGIVPQQNWSALAHLALGVTTVHDPSNTATEIFAAAEYQRTGAILAPRIFSTGDIVYGAHHELFANIDTLDDARDHVNRLKAQGAISIKNYNQPRREQRQMVVAAAREAGLMVVAEGGSLYHMDMNIIVDGNTGLEHNLPPERFYDDVLQLWPATGVGYTPTLVVTYGGLRGEDWFYQESDVWAHPILSKFVPPQVLQPRAVRRQFAPATDYQALRDSAANAKRLMQLGVTVNTGAHGQREGLGTHWEIWSFVLGGMSNMDALAAATINPAQYMGLARDIGSIEVGKLADLLIVQGDPLSNIRLTDDIAYVVLNGRLYEGGTLNERITGNRKLAPFYWQH